MLVMDMGNTNTQLALFSGDRIKERVALPTSSLTPDLVADALANLTGALDTREKFLWVASVAPGKNATVAAGAERTGCAYRFLAAVRDEIIPALLDTPETTGVDRLLAARAAGDLLFPDVDSGFIVVQCGSAATVDWVDADRRFRGGYIIPGPGLWLSGLARAAQLPDLAPPIADWIDNGPGLSTSTAMLNGLAVGLPAAVGAAVARLRRLPDFASRDSAIPVALTGGWAAGVLPLLGEGCRHEPDLVLYGINAFAQCEANPPPRHEGETL